jgi:HEAT repeat protein
MAPTLGLWLLLSAAQSSPQNAPVADPVYAGLKQSQWIAIAKDKTSRRRAKAIDVLGQISPGAVAAIPTLLEALQDPSSEIRLKAAGALARMDSAVDRIVPLLVERLNEKGLRPYAYEALYKMGSSAQAAVPTLLKMTQSADEDERFWGYLALWHILPQGQAETWREVLEVAKLAPGASKRRAQIQALAAKLAEDAAAICVHGLNQPDAAVRRATVDVLVEAGGCPSGAIPAVARVLRDPDRNLRRSATFVLMRLDRPKIPAEALRSSLTDVEVDVRIWAATLLRQAGPEARDALPSLVRALADSDSIVRGQSAFALAAIGPPAVPGLVETLKSQDINARRLAIFALGKIGPEAKSVKDALTPLLKDPDPEIRQSCANTLEKIGSMPAR